MPEVEIHILRASGRLDGHVDLIGVELDRGFRAAAAQLDLGTAPVDIVVRDTPALVIPELGVGGVAPDSHTIFVSLDPTHPRFEAAIRDEFPRLVAHELHHVARRRAGCRGTTLWAAIIHEGLADHFAVEVHGGEPPPWSRALAEPSLASMTTKALDEQGDETYDHRAWFVGTSEAEIPRWAGYAIGWRIVADYLMDHPAESARSLTVAPAEAFLPAL